MGNYLRLMYAYKRFVSGHRFSAVPLLREETQSIAPTGRNCDGDAGGSGIAPHRRGIGFLQIETARSKGVP